MKSDKLVIEFQDNELEVIRSFAKYDGVGVDEYIIVAALQRIINESLDMLSASIAT